MFIHARRRLIARALLALMLLAQAAVAWSACNLSTRLPERAMRTAIETMPCHEIGRRAACQAHCQAERQVVLKASIAVPAMPCAPVLVFVMAMNAESDLELPDIFAFKPGTGPPRRILLQSFQI